MRITTLTKFILKACFILGAAGAVTSCGEEYTYFDLYLSIDSSLPLNRRQLIEKCSLVITNEKNDLVQEYPTLPSGSSFGCKDGQTTLQVGRMSYSNMRPTGTLTFTLNAVSSSATLIAERPKGSDLVVIATGSTSAAVNPSPTPIELRVTAK